MFGSTLRLPGCLLSDDPIDRFSVSLDPSTDYVRSAEIRAAAQKALFREADVEAIHRAANARSRVGPKDELAQGMVVYVWRSSRKVRGWVGPGIVICISPQKTSVWVSMRGVVVKCSMDRVRRATDEEWLGAELIRVLSKDALQHMQRQGQRGYIDTSHEEPPPEAEDDGRIADPQELVPDPATDLPAPAADPPEPPSGD